MTSSHQNPDERDLLDFADAVAAGQNPQPRTDEERTYLHVHNAMQGESAAIPSTTKQSTWEDVMSTLALTPDAPVSNRTRKQQGLSSPPPRAPRARRMQWTPLASVAAALLVIIASFGVWLIMESGNGSTPDPPREAPHLAALVPIDASPEPMVLHSEAACQDMAADHPVDVITEEDAVFSATDDVAVVWLSSENSVMMRCPDDTLIVLAEEIDHLTDTNHPQVVRYGQLDQRLATQTYHHVRLGTTIDDNLAGKASNLGDSNGTGSIQFVISSNDMSQWSVADFDTMSQATLEEVTGVRLYTGQRLTTIASKDHQTIAIAASMYETEGSAVLLRVSGSPGDVAVFSSDFTFVTWVSAPEDFGPVNNIRLSDDGSQLTFIASPTQYNGISEEKSVIVDVATGDVVDED